MFNGVIFFKALFIVSITAAAMDRNVITSASFHGTQLYKNCTFIDLPEIKLTDLEQNFIDYNNTIAKQIYKQFDDKQYAVIGLGNSPIIIIILLREKFKYEEALTLPFSGLKELDTACVTDMHIRNFKSYIELFICTDTKNKKNSNC